MTGAVIGTGYMGKTHAAIFKPLTDRLLLCSNDLPTGQALAAELDATFYNDYTQLLEKEKPDFISVCLPTFLHFSAVQSALRNGIPVLCEKPFTLDENSALALVTLSQETGTPLMVAHCLRFSRPYAYLKKVLREGTFGPLKSLHMYRNSPKPNWSVGNWFASTQRSGGIIRDLHIHDTDMAVNLLGVPKAVYTSATECSCSSVFDYGKNLTVTAEASWRSASAFPFSAGFDAVFEKACLVYANEVLTLYEDSRIIPSPEEAPLFPELTHSDPMKNELRYFLRCITSGTAPALCPPEESLQTIFLSCAQSRSAESGCFEAIPFPSL